MPLHDRMKGEAFASRTYFYVGGSYEEGEDGESYMSGQMYVEHLMPSHGVTQPYPLVLIHGAAQTGTVCPHFRPTYNALHLPIPYKLNNALTSIVADIELVEQTRRWSWLGRLVPPPGLRCVHHRPGQHWTITESIQSTDSTQVFCRCSRAKIHSMLEIRVVATN